MPPWTRWEYAANPSWAAEVQRRSLVAIDELGQGKVDVPGFLKNTKTLHKTLFDGLTPPGLPHFAGNYRGTLLTELHDYPIEVPSSTPGAPPLLSGTPPGQVADKMRLFADRVDGALWSTDKSASNGKGQNFRLNACHRAAELVSEFCRIHPYVNGNGHIGRYIVWAFLSRYGILPVRWTVDPRPTLHHPTYDYDVWRHQNGQPFPLIMQILKCCEDKGDTGTQVAATTDTGTQVAAKPAGAEVPGG